MLTDAELREGVHVLLLRHLVEALGPDSFVLKGGVNLRLYFGSVRYSEDIDLDGDPGSVGSLRDAIRGFIEDTPRAIRDKLRELRIERLDPGEGVNRDTRTVLRYGFGVIGPGRIRYPTKIEVSYRGVDPKDRAELTTAESSIVSRYLSDQELQLRRYSRASAVRQKIAALAGRSVPQARDVFDLHLLAQGALAPGSLAGALEPRALDEAKERALAISYRQFRGQVVEFLGEEDREKFDSRERWDEIRLDVIEFVERLVDRPGAEER